MRVLVTGGAGYVGSVLVRDLVDAGYGVRVLDNLSQGLRCGSHLFESRLEFAFGDIRDRGAIAQALGGCDIVVHLAAVVGYPACAGAPREAREVNVEGTRNVLSEAGGRPAIILSTLSTLGKVGTDECDERTEPRPVSVYGSTKLEAESISLSYGDAVILRPATAFGVAPQMRFDLLVHRLALDAVSRNMIEIYEPKSMRCFVHVRDLSRTIVHAIKTFESMRGSIYHVGNSNLNVTKEYIGRLLRDITGCTVHLDAAGSDGDARDYGGSFGRLEAAGFKAEESLEDGVRELLQRFIMVHGADRRS